ncbi:hypothetical protein [Actinoplanes siamensis]|uniref:Uncharacterized protein n=1 Tax=Actinoplanes siamensis TaxID=1223317 RepID=A0A919N4N0_9ACTN|nr:hypothetical protein [Actinoplanes siamensis]GIF04316.1 hypothetical protein Asi03nite_18540 [Actinoplanes siamensis]
MVADRTRIRTILAGAMLLSGGAAVVGSFLPRAYLRFPVVGETGISGSLTSELFTAFLGVVLAGYAVPALRGERLPLRVVLVASGAGLLLFLRGVWESAHLTSLAAALIAADDGARIGPGLWMCMIGGLAGAVAAAGLAFRRPRTAADQ